MTIQEIITLTNAGWTKEEIMSLTSKEQQPEQPAEQPQEPEQPAEQPQQPDQPAQPDRMQQLETKLDYVINRFNLLAVQQSHQPEQHQESIEDILASVVRGATDPDKK